MRLKILANGNWQVLAEVDSRGFCAVDDALAEYLGDRKFAAAATGLFALWQRIPNEGPRRLGTELYHRVDEDHGIYEFIKGALRVYCFEAKGRLVVCSHAEKKSTQKTKNKDRQRAIDLRKRYLTAEVEGSLEIVADEDE